jgi:hypothetical protein
MAKGGCEWIQYDLNSVVWNADATSSAEMDPVVNVLWCNAGN